MATVMGCGATVTMRFASAMSPGVGRTSGSACGNKIVIGGPVRGTAVKINNSVKLGGAASVAATVAAGRGYRRRSARCLSRGLVVAAAEEGTVGERVMNAAGSPEEEAAGLATMRAALDAASVSVPCDDETALWFLRDRKMDADAASAKLIEFLQWRQGLGDITDDVIAPSVNSGAAYVHPHLDKEGRAVIVVEISKHDMKARDLEVSKKHAVKCVEECLQKMKDTPGGGSGAIYAVWDMKGFSGSNADLDLAKFCILDVFRKYYPKRLSQVAAIDSPWAFKPVWAILKPIIGKYSSVVQFVKVPEVLANFEEGEAPACLLER